MQLMLCIYTYPSVPVRDVARNELDAELAIARAPDPACMSARARGLADDASNSSALECDECTWSVTLSDPVNITTPCNINMSMPSTR